MIKTLDDLIAALQQIKEVHITAGDWPVLIDGIKISEVQTIENSSINIISD
jgi:hypothetical protein